MSAAARGTARAAVLLVLAGGGPAFATATLDCWAEDGAAAFDVAAAVSHGLGASLSNVRASVTLKAKDVPPALARLELDGEALVHHWLWRKELKLHFHHERGEAPAATLELVIQARAAGAEEDGFSGRYVLILTEPGQAGAADRVRTFRGKVACSVG